MKSKFLLILGLLAASTANAQITMNFDATRRGPQISPYQYGLFFEEINHAGDGGLYAEMIANRSFEDNNSNPDTWWKIGNVSWTLTQENLLNPAQHHALKLSTTSASTGNWQGVYNEGYWGMSFVKDSTYTLSFFAKAGNSGYTKDAFKIQLQTHDGSVIGEGTLNETITRNEWKKYTVRIKATGTAKTGRLALITSNNGILELDVLSLFPYTWKNRKNGMRPDLAQLLYDTHPKFLRFPGGCYVEGQDSYDNAFQWKKTLGPIENRPGHQNVNWGYRSQDGLGFDEYLQFCEDLGAAPLFVVNIGLGHNFTIPVSDIDSLVQNTLDAIEYANGDATTEWGARRIANGHEAPYHLKFIEIGNENYQAGASDYPERYKKFYDAIKAKYPDIICIGNVEAWGTDNPSWRNDNPVDLVDEHYYRTSNWMQSNYNKYDNYSRAIGVYNGEYAANSGNYGTYGNLKSALGEAVYMMGQEKNSDVCRMGSFAPIFTHEKNPVWPYDMIHFNAANHFCTPSYYVQKLFGQNTEGQNLKWTETGNEMQNTKSIALGTWNTQVSYDDVNVVDAGGNTIVSDNFSSDNGWKNNGGAWSTSGGTKIETGNATPALSINTKTLPDNYTITLKARKDGGNEGFLIAFDYYDDNNYTWWNIGGWGNTQHAVEICRGGSKTTTSATSGSIETGIWYNLKIEVAEGHARLYINDELVNECDLADSPAASKAIYQSAQLNDAGDKMTLKIVNPTSETKTVKLNFTNMKAESGSVIRLTSNSDTDENTMNDPYKVVPSAEETLPNVNEVEVPAYSMNIFKLNISDAIAETADSVKAIYDAEDADKYGYLYAHMNSSKEITNYALSRYGDTFDDLLSGGEVFDTKAYTTTGGMRDAYVGRLQNGMFLLAGTDMTSSLGWTSNHIMDLMLSPDLVHWTKEVKIDLESKENLKALGLSSSNDMTAAWAPQFIYDSLTGKYVLYYSVGFPDQHRIYYQLFDENLNILTAPKLYFDPGYDLIDADIQYNAEDGQYIMIYKSENSKHNLYQARATQLVPGDKTTGTCQWTIDTRFDYTEGNASIEAPSLYRKIGEKNWRLAYQNYSGGGYSFVDLDEHCSNPMNMKRMGGDVHPQHGSFLKLTEKEYNYLLDWDSVKTMLPVAQQYYEQYKISNLKEAVDKANEALTTTTTFDENATRMKEALEALRTVTASVEKFIRDEINKGNATDITSLIVNPYFSGKAEGWTTTPGFTNADGNVAEYWNTNFDFYQDIENIPAGEYELSVQSFYRNGGVEAAHNSHEDGTEALNAILYANNTSVPVMSIYDDTIDDYYYYNDRFFSYPDNVSQANNSFNADGNYINILKFSLNKPETIRIGIKKDAYVDNDWCCFDNFTLKYLGNSTGIKSYHAGDSGSCKVYDLGGKLLNKTPEHGVYIQDKKKIAK